MIDDMTIQELGVLKLKIGEIVVAATYFRDYVLVITDRGTVYKMLITDC